jgi:hypothetical protein
MASQRVMKRSGFKIFSFAICVSIMLLSACASTRNYRVSHARHPNLAEAQTAIENAIDRLNAAQVANDYDMDGHAEKAKALCKQAYIEIKYAAEAANAHR